ncbi:MAG: YggS family pyridoxal phosphate-dependent enzyme [Armatimonadota bacterium]
MSKPPVDIKTNIERVRERIAKAAERAGRNPSEILLVGATKQVPVERIREAITCGLTDFGENYVQEALPKIKQIGPGVRWHFIGSLQRNKAKYVVGRFCLVHSVDSLELGLELGRRASAAGLLIPVLVEVNVGGESTKSGVAPNEALSLVEKLRSIQGISVRGLMGIPPPTADPEQARPYFRTLKSLFDQLDNECRQYLSMGMSADFEQAIEEGANLVRIGTGIFGPRTR